ncbi:phage tail sheath family protein [Mesorhizobium sp. IMUNJ 23232]|uniref:phage tail sheath family protein n=1 Tax=Mesorhizobium sp. IMUNJ 23232 TaxID=3376064 RepID=UPI0037ACD2C1
MPVSVTYPGVYIQEAKSGAPTISAVATSVGAFVGMTPAGPVNAPTLVFSAREFDAIFAGDTDVGEMLHQVRQFFLNGGPRAWIIRTAENAGTGAALMAASTLRNEFDTASVLLVRAKSAGADGNRIRVEVDYGTPSPERTFNMTVFSATVKTDGSIERTNELVHRNLSMDPTSPRFVETIVNAESPFVSVSSLAVAPVAGERQGISQAALVLTDSDADNVTILSLLIDATHNQLMISVAGGAPVIATLTAPAAGSNAAQIGAGIQTAINNALALASQTATVTADVSQFGSGRRIRVSCATGPVVISAAPQRDVTGNLQLGIANGGVECDGYTPLRPAPTGFVTKIHGTETANTRLNRLGHLAAIDKAAFAQLTLTGAPGTFNGPAATFVAAGRIVAGTAFAAPNTAGSLKNVAENLGILASVVNASAAGNYTAIVQGYRLVIKPLFGTHDGDLTMTLFNSGAAPDSISGNGALAQNGGRPANVRSYAIGMAPPATGLTTPAAANFRVGNQPGSNGEPPLPKDYTDAYELLERDADIFNMLILPRALGETKQQVDGDRANLWGPASAFCKKRRAFLIVDPPSDAGTWSKAQTAAAGVKALRSGMEIDHAAVYWPRVKIADPRGKVITIDPSGTMAGVYAATDVKRGVWKAPAGLEASLIGVRGLEYLITDEQNGSTNTEAVNTLRSMSTGAVSWGARNMVGFSDNADQDWKYVPVRRIALFIEESLYRGLKFAVFEPNAEPLWAQIRLAAGAFMNNLFRQGAFKGLKSSDAYYVACDATTTRQNDINLGIVNVEVGFAPLKPAEFIVVTIKQLAGQIEV